ncbi:alpha/beta hydrolase [Tomitella biformata]|uniref:alpha/beta hydrolase n=1 Tax=Tomitella biformata TaxID=630403 RepID=UPI000467D959|nr:alpha/beta hydrolase-fold protein [Tomitella biformata]
MRMLDWSLLTGPVPVIIAVLGGLGAIWLLARVSRRHLLRNVPLTLAGAVIVAVVMWLVVEKLWHPFPDPLPLAIYVWTGLGVWAVLLVVPRILASRRRLLVSVVSVLAAVLVVLTSAAQINLHFDAYPTIGNVVGRSAVNTIDFAELPPRQDNPIMGAPLEASWTAPAEMPSVGSVTTAAIPATASGFTARPAEVYVPPAYFTARRPLLPVLVLLAGQPGGPGDWFAGGNLERTMNNFAHAHQGLAPIVVVADGTGSEFANPLCVDSHLGNVATYLTVDVPAWITGSFEVDPDHKAWAIGGLSYGGTCALQMSTLKPEVYPTFINLSGQLEPTLGDHNTTVDQVFGGNAAAFAAVNPMDLMKSRSYPNVGGYFVVGAGDDQYKAGLRTVYEAAKAAGMDVQFDEVPGGHSFDVWSRGLADSLPFISHRMGLTS